MSHTFTISLGPGHGERSLHGIAPWMVRSADLDFKEDFKNYQEFEENK